MNKTIHLLGVQLIIASVMLISCNKDKNESSSSKGQITFSFANTLSKDNVKSSSDSAATANLTAAIVSIEDANGNLVQNGVTISLTNINGMYISTPIALVTGTYQLTEFLLVNQNNQVEYASPLKSSKLAYLVSNPLPNSFSIQSNAVTNLSPEVISTNGSNPADFGYGTFGFKVDSTFNF